MISLTVRDLQYRVNRQTNRQSHVCQLVIKENADDDDDDDDEETLLKTIHPRYATLCGW